MMILPITLHIIFLSIYASLVAALLWHYRKYSLPHDPARWVLGPFIAFSLIFAVIATILLFIVPWDDLMATLVSQLSYPPIY